MTWRYSTKHRGTNKRQYVMHNIQSQETGGLSSQWPDPLVREAAVSECPWITFSIRSMCAEASAAQYYLSQDAVRHLRRKG